MVRSGTNGRQSVNNSKYTYFRLKYAGNAQFEFSGFPANKFTGMKIIAMIPARYAATRFPAKLMQPLGNKTVIRHTYDNTLATGLFDEVMVVTDSDVIYQEIV